MVKSATFEPKKAIGIGLRPSLWQRIDAFADAQGKSRNQVIEEILNLHIPAARDLRKTHENVRKAQDSGINWSNVDG